MAIPSTTSTDDTTKPKTQGGVVSTLVTPPSSGGVTATSTTPATAPTPAAPGTPPSALASGATTGVPVSQEEWQSNPNMLGGAPNGQGFRSASFGTNLSRLSPNDWRLGSDPRAKQGLADYMQTVESQLEGVNLPPQELAAYRQFYAPPGQGVGMPAPMGGMAGAAAQPEGQGAPMSGMAGTAVQPGGQGASMGGMLGAAVQPGGQGASITAPTTPGYTQQPVSGAVQAQVSPWNPTQRTVTPDQTVQGQLENVLSADGPLLQRTRAQMMQQWAARGLVNSSMAETGAMDAVLGQALNIATPDAAKFETASRDNWTALNQSGQFNAAAQNEGSRFNASQENEFRGREQAARIQADYARLSSQLDTASRERLMAIDQNYRTLTNGNAQAAQLVSQMQDTIGRILADPNITPENKQALINQAMQAAQSSLRVIGSISGMNFDNLLNFNTPGGGNSGGSNNTNWRQTFAGYEQRRDTIPDDRWTDDAAMEYMEANPDIKQAYQQGHFNQHGATTMRAAAAWHWNNQGRTEPGRRLMRQQQDGSPPPPPPTPPPPNPVGAPGPADPPTPQPNPWDKSGQGG